MLKKICSFLSTIVLLLLAAIALVLIGPRLLGYDQYAVLSGSMEPNIHVGAIVYDKEADPTELAVGDIITYRLSEGTLVTHRVTAIDHAASTVTTKGDANEAEDSSPVAFDDIVGRYAFSIPYIGYISIYGKTPLGIGVVCGILILLILLNFLPDIFSDDDSDKEKSKESKKEKSHETKDELEK